VAADWGIGFAGKVVIPRIVGAGDQARVRVDDNRHGVFACRQAGRDVIGGCTGGAGVGSVEGVIDGCTGTSLSVILTEADSVRGERRNPKRRTNKS